MKNASAVIALIVVSPWEIFCFSQRGGVTVSTTKNTSAVIAVFVVSPWILFIFGEIIFMHSEAFTPDQYYEQLPSDRKEPMTKLRKEIKKNIPKGFQEVMGYGNVGYVVPHSLYPAGYHCDPKLPLPFLGTASQKNFIAVYHMGIYADPKLLDWFTGEYAKQVKGKLDMGKSCIRFKNPDNIPFRLIGELAGKMTVAEWVDLYESEFKDAGKRK